MGFEYTVLENGLDFILAAIGDLSKIDEGTLDSNASKRHIKYSLLHLSSGIELVFKHKLLQGNWAYVFKDMDKAKKENLESGDFVSVGSDIIIKRLENLCDMKLARNDADIISILRRKRNNAEHFSLKDDISSLKGLIHNCITVLIKIILDHYDSGQFTDEELDLFSKIRSSLHKLDQHYDDALAIAQNELEKSGMESEVLTCPQCLEEFLLIDSDSYDGYGGAKCSSCSYEAPEEEAARDYISKVMGVTDYEIAKVFSGEIPLYDCPDCNDWSLVFDEPDDNAICFSCGFNENCVVLLTCSDCEKRFISVQYAGDDSASCPECGEDVPYDEA